MDNLNDLRALWQTAPTGLLPTPEAMLQTAKGFKNRKLRSKLLLIAMAITAACFIAVIAVCYPAMLWCTLLGQILIIVACVILAATNLLSLRRFYQPADGSNKQFILFLEKTRQNQAFYFYKTQPLCMSLYTIGLLLSLYEWVQGTIVLFVTSYLLLVAYLLVLWLVVRPRVYRKEALKINALIHQAQQIACQF